MDFALYTKVSYLLGFVVILAHVITSIWKKSPAQLSDGILLLLATTSIPPCVRVIIIFYQYKKNTIKEIGGSEQSYIMIGALAVIWLSINEIWKKFRDKIYPPV